MDGYSVRRIVEGKRVFQTRTDVRFFVISREDDGDGGKRECGGVWVRGRRRPRRKEAENEGVVQPGVEESDRQDYCGQDHWGEG